MLKAIIFDYGNVLVKDNYTSWYIAKALKVSRQKLWPKMKIMIDDYVVGKISKRQFWKYILKEMGMKNGVKEEKKYDRIILSLYEKTARPKYDTIKIVKKLKMAGYKILILSNVTPELALLRKRMKFTKVFHNTFFSPEIKMQKPQTRVFLYVAEKMKVKPNECLVIDNYPLFAKAARKAGMKAILFKNSRQLENSLKRLGVL